MYGRAPQGGSVSTLVLTFSPEDARVTTGGPAAGEALSSELRSVWQPALETCAKRVAGELGLSLPSNGPLPLPSDVDLAEIPDASAALLEPEMQKVFSVLLRKTKHNNLELQLKTTRELRSRLISDSLNC